MKNQLIFLPVCKTLFREYQNSYDITHKMDKRSIDLIIYKNSYTHHAIHSIYIYEPGGKLLHYYEQGHNSLKPFLNSISYAERIIIKRWLKKFSTKKGTYQTLNYLHKQVKYCK